MEVYSASSGDNSPLDAESAVDISGGTVLAVGAAGMGISTASGGQAYVSFGGSGMGGMQGGMQAGGSALTVSAGDEISILDPDGNVIYTAKAVRAASWVFFSSAELRDGETYTLSVNGTAAATAEAGAAGMAGGMGGMQGGFPGGFGGERPEMPEGGFSGERPTPPEGGFNGERPEMPEGEFSGERPEIPEGGFNGERPEMPEGGFGAQQGQSGQAA